MKLTVYLDQLDSHAHFRLFVNGAKAGDLCVTHDEWFQLRRLLEDGAWRPRNPNLLQIIDNRDEPRALR